jgi:hypothetical protein
MIGADMVRLGFKPHRFVDTFQKRIAEWGMALTLLGWGQQVRSSAGLFDREYYRPLAYYASQISWAHAAIAVGAFHLVMLGINGRWPKSVGCRIFALCFSNVFWVALFICSSAVGWRAPGTALYGGYVLMTWASAWFAAREAVANYQAHARSQLPSGDSRNRGNDGRDRDLGVRRGMAGMA